MPSDPTSNHQQRRLLRRETLARRDTLTPAERTTKSLAIAGHLAKLPQLRAARTIFTYVNFRSEVETLRLISAWLATGKQVCVPLTIPAGHQLAAYRISDPGRDITLGYQGIPEPNPQRASLVNPAEIEVVVLPGSVFDLHGGRLGYGGGFYDRFLADQAPQALRVGLAFELQVAACLPLMAHDQPLEFLVTERRLLAFPRRTIILDKPPDDK